MRNHSPVLTCKPLFWRTSLNYETSNPNPERKDVHNLTPVYVPCSWSVSPAAECDELVLDPELTAKLIAKMAAAISGRYDAMVSTSAPARRNRVAEMMGDEYVEGLDADKLAFLIAMLQP
jgi:hypothetical protein